MAKAKRRIPFAYYKEAWNPKNGNPDELCAMAEKIIPTEYHSDMDGKIFCPACFTNLNRVPKEKELFSNQRESFFLISRDGSMSNVTFAQASLKAKDTIHGKKRAEPSKTKNS